jgi:hypothetical protein
MADELTDATAATSAAAAPTSTNGAAAANGHADEATVAPPVARANELPAPLIAALELPSTFEFNAVEAELTAPLAPTPTLGPLANFKDTFTGHGFNTIFRPDSPVTPTPFPVPPTGPSDNVLELNLTNETLSFSPNLGSVPNRGSVQADAFLNGVPYLQTVSDVTNGRPIGIHFEPGLWIIVPPTGDPKEGSTLARMASIPHGTTINAQGTFHQHAGPPTIRKAEITPFAEGSPGSTITFPSQTATDKTTRRIPQDLTSFIADGTITQAILDDPNTALREALTGLHITHTTAISIATAPALPLFGGGTDNIAFLWGDAAAVKSANPSGQNAQTVQMTATFWIETVQRTLTVHPLPAGKHEVTIKPASTGLRQPVPSFLVRPPHPLTAPTDITVSYTQIQYTQRVVLNFAGLGWPHISVATLVPAKPVTVAPGAFH